MKKRYYGDRVFDSKWEKELHEGLLKNAEFHPKEKIEYEIPHKYSPDFILECVDEQEGKSIIIEAKGRFRDSLEARKYIFISQQLHWKESPFKFVFLFYNHKTPMPHAKKRKDGTKQTHGEWATKNGFEWYTEETFPKEWL